MTKAIRWMGLVFGGALAACGGGDGSSPKQLCDDLVETSCGKFYECLSDAEIAASGLPPTEPGCISQLKVQFGCDEVTTENACEGNETYHDDEASACVDQTAELGCDQVRDGTGETPACSRVCTVE